MELVRADGWGHRPIFVRWLGLFGSLCCATDAFLAGAGPTIRYHVNLVNIVRGSHGPVIIVLWFAGLAALCVAWWRGRLLAEGGQLTRRWILGTAALWSAPMLIVPPLASRDLYANACQGALFDAGLNPYAVGVSAQPCPWLDSVSTIWRDTPTPYGPVFIMLAGVAAATGSQLAAIAVLRVFAVLGVLGIAAGLPVLARRVGQPVERALWWVLCCPIVPLHLIGGGHSDALTMALLVAGLALLAAPSRQWGPLVAGSALLGSSIAVKTTIGVVLPFAVLLAVGGWSAAGYPRLLKRGGVIAAVSLGVLAVASIVSGLGFGWVAALSGAGKSVNWSSPPTAVGLVINTVGSWGGAEIDAVPAVRLVALVLLVVALPLVLWHSRDRDPLVGAALALLVVIFLAPITQPWYLIWPLVLLVVTPVRGRWLAGTVVFSTFMLLPDGNGTWQPLKLGLAFLMTALVGWVGYRSVQWLRGVEVQTIADAGHTDGSLASTR